MTQISMKKKYVTRDGRSVRILAVDMQNAKFPVAAAMMSGHIEHPGSFTAEGHYYEDTEESCADLFEVSPFKKDDRVMVRNSHHALWNNRRFFHSMHGDEFVCYDDGRCSWSGEGMTSTWDECRAYDPKIDGE